MQNTVYDKGGAFQMENACVHSPQKQCGSLLQLGFHPQNQNILKGRLLPALPSLGRFKQTIVTSLCYL